MLFGPLLLRYCDLLPGLSVCGAGVTSKLSEATSKWTASLSDLKAKLATAKVSSKTPKDIPILHFKKTETLGFQSA
jgi:hypothetical protein